MPLEWHRRTDRQIWSISNRTLIAYKRMQNQGTKVEYKKYAGLDHDSVVFGSFRDQVRWVQDRFDRKPVEYKSLSAQGCGFLDGSSRLTRVFKLSTAR
jgi:hypothetical protein